MKLIVPVICDKFGSLIPRATVRLNTGPNAWVVGFTDELGMAILYVDESLQNTQFECYACNYKDLGLSINLGTGDKQIRVGMVADPSRPQDIILPGLERSRPNWSREDLLRFRGSLNIKSSKPYLPMFKNGVEYAATLNGTVSTNGSWHRTDEELEFLVEDWKERNYSHGSMGPFIDGGYHEITPPTDFRNDSERDRIEKTIEFYQENGIITPLFLTPDGWTVDQLRTIEPIFKSDFWQGIGSIVVNGFEQQGSKYGWSNSQYVEYMQWVRETFPRALCGLHTVSKIEVPVGRGDDTSKPGMSANECWGRVAKFTDFWLYQDDMWDYAWVHVDPNNPDGKTDLQHWYELWDKNNSESFVQRFSPLGKWNLASNIVPIAGEFWSYGMVWRDLPEQQGRDYGKTAIDLGVNGSFDGC